MNYLVTGGAGFIGSNFLNYMLEKYPDDHFFCMDFFTYAGNYKSIEKFLGYENFTLIVADISDKDIVEKYFQEFQFDIVVNFAAESHVDNSIIDATVFLKTNILGTHVLLEAARKYGCSRFHQVSTDEVYGDLPLNKPDLKFDELHRIIPSSPYSASKASADLIAFSYYRTYGLKVTISRSSNNYGPFQYPEKLIPLMILNTLNNRPLPVYGDGLNIRDWIHVLDHCTAIDLIIHKGSIGEVYNIGGNEEKSNISVVKEILDLCNRNYSLVHYVTDRKGHDLRYAIDSSKLEELGWDRKYTFYDGLKSTIEWYRNNNNWLESLDVELNLPYGTLIRSHIIENF
jgi:dTDP-glucose 4,6-dehydratase